ncbi:hypothetical protein RFI_13389 [Reticulomyxa filosa]|uniref:RGS domain-containing protein n=1 Tax=Reticulomyxa filosa TaxID=46433 RepID=X6NEL6_RETFI|nr:hypothetical protein RFI_13389 [Reticulomyxa filosa]|eukprot:ETO23787.1 hypothetical protein RFI_13389 [Reticulomyxa filosa]
MPQRNSNIPKSAIVHDNWNENIKVPASFQNDKYKAIAYILFRRYVREDAALQINISYRSRQKIKEKFNAFIAESECPIPTLSHRELFEVFDSAIKEQLLLLRDSESRFITSDEYSKLSGILSET